MSWNPRTLDSLLGKSGGDRAGKRNFPVLSITMRDGLVDQSEKFKKRVASLVLLRHILFFNFSTSEPEALKSGA